MAVERKSKNRRKLNELQEAPTKEEYAVAKFLRFNVPVRQGKLVGMEVQCFFANKAVDALMESKWSAAKKKKEPLFTNRASCSSYCNRLLQKGLFHRAEKMQRSKDRDKTKKKKKLKEGEKEEESTEETLRERKKKEKKSKKDGDGEKAEEEEKEEIDKKEEKKPEKEEEKKKKEKRLRLNMHDDQWFVDGEEVYVWIYDPVPLKTFLIGLLMVLGAIALCLFPLWPEGVRVGVYYLSLAAAGFVLFILTLVVVRFVLFCLVWLFTLGKHHFWFLPNLTEDVGFFDSFKPLYKHELRDKNATDKSKDKKDDKKEIVKDDGGKGDQKKEPIEKEENSGSDKSENGEFEMVEKSDLGEEGEEEDGRNEEEIDEEIEEEDENDFDEEESEDNSEVKKDK